MMIASQRFFFMVVVAANLYTVQSSVTSDQLANITFRLYNGKTFEEYVDRLVGEAAEIVDLVDSDKPTVFYVHGWDEDFDVESFNVVISAYLARQDHNILAVDWSEIAGLSYATVVNDATKIGSTIAAALDTMVANGFDDSTLHLVGHSMGGQMCGYIGRSTTFTVPRITGLDPAGPLFNLVNPNLSAGDAAFVDTIHTDFGVYGALQTIADVDFFPNGGIRIQPGCPKIFTALSTGDFCSHCRSWRFYAESLLNEDAFVGIECATFVQFKLGFCNKNSEVIMGYRTPAGTTGVYFLQTNAEPPYGRETYGTTYYSSLS